MKDPEGVWPEPPEWELSDVRVTKGVARYGMLTEEDKREIRKIVISALNEFTSVVVLGMLVGSAIAVLVLHLFF